MFCFGFIFALEFEVHRNGFSEYIIQTAAALDLDMYDKLYFYTTTEISLQFLTKNAVRILYKKAI